MNEKCYSTDDTIYGTKYVYCGQHLRVHEVGWCTVSALNKIPLFGETEKEAHAEWEMKLAQMNLKHDFGRK